VIKGPRLMNWTGEEPAGECTWCGGQCAPECGKHPLGCTYSWHSEWLWDLFGQWGYWKSVPECDLYHGKESEGGE